MVNIYKVTFDSNFRNADDEIFSAGVEESKTLPTYIVAKTTFDAISLTSEFTFHWVKKLELFNSVSENVFVAKDDAKENW